MKHLNFHTILRKTESGWNLLIHNRENILEQLIEYFTLSLDDKVTELWFDTTMKPKSEDKTNPQMGYYRAEILQKALYGYHQAGFNQYDIDDVHFILKYKYHYKLVYIPDEDNYQRMPISLARANRVDMSDFIDKCIQFIQEDLQTQVQTPDDYFQLRDTFNLE